MPLLEQSYNLRITKCWEQMSHSQRRAILLHPAINSKWNITAQHIKLHPAKFEHR